MSDALGNILRLLFFLIIPYAPLKPWMGVIGYYAFSIMAPANLWHHIFGSTRFAFLLSAMSMLGFMMASASGKINFSILKEKQNTRIMILWLAIVCSYHFNPYGNEITLTAGRSSFGTNPKGLLSVFNNVYIFYFIAILVINKRKHLHFAIIAFLMLIVYYIYWANDRYFSGLMWSPRLCGPTGGAYFDENTFAMLFVSGSPSLYFMGDYYKSKIIKYGLWMAVPLAWHAAFLTGSMGGFIGLAMTTFFIAFRSKKKLFMVGIPIVLAVAFITQGGSYLKNKSEGKDLKEGEESTSDQRKNAWKVGLKIMVRYPLTGAGVGNFKKAYPDFSDSSAHIAHNTFFQFGGESGPIAGLMYLLIVKEVFTSYLRQRKMDTVKGFDPFLLAAKESITGSILGFFLAAMFLNLGTYEIFYYLLILHGLQKRLAEKELKRLEGK